MRIINFSKACGSINDAPKPVSSKARITQFKLPFKTEQENITIMRVQGIKYVTVESAIDVHVMSWDATRIEIRLKSESVEPAYKVRTHIGSDEIIIEAVCEEEKLMSNVTLEIILPNRQFEQLSIQTVKGNITVEESLKAEVLVLRSNSLGKIISLAQFEKADLYAWEGDIAVKAEAMDNIVLKAYIGKGNANIILKNVKALMTLCSAMSGKTKNFHKSNGKFSADISVVVMMGNITIK